MLNKKNIFYLIFFSLAVVLIIFFPKAQGASNHININIDLQDIRGWSESKFSIGDIDNDTKTEFIILDRTSYNFLMKAIDDDGKTILWQRQTGYQCDLDTILADDSRCWQGQSFIVWDIDSAYSGEEIIADFYINNRSSIAILNGKTGEVIRSRDWPKANGTPDQYIHQMTVAYLDGKIPSLIIQSGIYSDDHVFAYDKNLNQLWRFDPQDHGLPASGGHFIFPDDFDNDGKDEVVHGSILINEDGTLYYAKKLHADATYIWDFNPGHAGKEVFFCIEGKESGKSSPDEGIFLVGINDKKILWQDSGTSDGKNGWDHCHNAFFGEFLSNSGLEFWTQGGNYIDGENIGPPNRIFSYKGDLLKSGVGSGDAVEWDGDEGRTEVVNNDGVSTGHSGSKILNFNVEIDKNDHMSADFNNDGKETIVAIGNDGNLHLFNKDPISLPLERNIYDRWYWIIRSVVAVGHWNWMPKSNAFGATIPTPPPVKTGDLNNDNKVDIIDLGILLSNWNSTSKPPADINRDGQVDVVDLGILLSNWD